MSSSKANSPNVNFSKTNKNNAVLENLEKLENNNHAKGTQQNIILEIRDIKKNFENLEVLKSINLKVNKGDVFAILGPSGSGKTTLLRCINFLEKANEGTIIFDGKTYDAAKATKKEIREFRMKTAFVFQNYNLFANKTAIENVMEGLVIARKISKEDAHNKAIETLKKVGMLDKANSYPIQLSGGQQQRVAIARAIATDPKIIFFDEPTSALDPELTGEVLSVMKTLAQDGMTMLVVTHEMKFARSVATRTMFMENGFVIEEGPTSEVFESPKEKRTQEFINRMELSTF